MAPSCKGAAPESKPIPGEYGMRFMAYLELKIPDSALLLMDAGRTKDVAYFKKEAKQAMNDIEAVKKRIYTSTMLERDSRGMYYRCRYHNPKDKYPNFYEVEVFFSDAGAKRISKINFIGRKELIRLHILYLKAANEIPPPPPIIKQ